MNLRRVNLLAWNCLKKLPGIFKTWGDAFRHALKVLTKWRSLRSVLAEHFEGLSRLYRNFGDQGRSIAFSRAAQQALQARSYARFTTAPYVGPSIRLEAQAALHSAPRNPRRLTGAYPT